MKKLMTKGSMVLGSDHENKVKVSKDSVKFSEYKYIPVDSYFSS